MSNYWLTPNRQYLSSPFWSWLQALWASHMFLLSILSAFLKRHNQICWKSAHTLLTSTTWFILGFLILHGLVSVDHKEGIENWCKSKCSVTRNVVILPSCQRWSMLISGRTPPAWSRPGPPPWGGCGQGGRWLARGEPWCHTRSQIWRERSTETIYGF